MNRNDLTNNHQRLVSIQAKKQKRKTPYIPFDELVSAGNLGLMRAAASYDESKGAFAPYACKCIMGSIKDSLYEQQHWGKWKSAHVTMISLEECSDLELPYYDNQQGFEEIIEVLNPLEQTIMRLYFVDSFNCKQIGLRLGRTESWVAKSKKQIVRKLRSYEDAIG
jgi:RNA polymerase sigma factor (sigma-70 family)